MRFAMKRINALLALIVMFIIGATLAMASVPLVSSLTANEEFLCSVANDTWSYFNASTTSTTASSCYNCTVLGHGFPRGSKDITSNSAGYSANVAEAGFYMSSVVSAYELGFIDSAAAMKKLRQTLDTLYYLQGNASESYKGLFYQWYNTDSAKPKRTSDYRIPSVDNAWLALSLVAVNRFAYERGNATLENLSSAILKKMNFSFLFNENNALNQPSNNEAGDSTNPYENNTFAQYYDTSTSKYSGTFWNIYGDEGRIVAFAARIIERKSAGNGITINQLSKYLNTTYHPWLFEKGNYSRINVTPVSWTGSFFTYSSPAIFLKEFSEFMGRNATQALLAQVQYAKDKGYAYFGQTAGSKISGGYEDFGTPPAHSWNSAGYKDGGVVNPSASFLALAIGLNASLQNDVVSNALGIRNNYANSYRTSYPYGYAETLGINASNNGSVSNIWASLTHGFVLSSIADYLKSTIWHYFYADSDARAVHLEYGYTNNTEIKQKAFSCLSKPAGTGNVILNNKKLYVNGTEFKARGVAYQPVPIGESPNTGYKVMEHPELFQRDFPVLRSMGANTIRTWAKVESNAFLDQAYNNGTNSIYVVMGMWINPELNFSESSNRTYVLNEFKDYVARFKGHLAVLAWAIGNEENYRSKDDIPDWYTLADEMARAAYEIEGIKYHPTLIVNGDLKYIGNSSMNSNDSSLNYVDVWGSNAYRGYSFNDVNFFQEYTNKSSKPLLITEYGIDAFNNSARAEYQDMQAKYAGNLWDEINASNITLGGIVMAYSDEWWKNSTGNANAHDPGGYSGQCDQPDCTKDEEYWGIVAIADNGSSVDALKPRQAYYTLKSRFANKSEMLQKGFTFSSWWYNDYLQPVSDTSLELLNQTGTEYISLIVSWYQDTTSSTRIYRNSTKTPSDAALVDAINKIHSLGMKVMLKPHIEVADGTSKTEIQPSSWNEWFANYTSFINYYANLSETYGVEQFSIGTELKKTSSRSEWKNITVSVRNLYHGQLAYAANFDEYNNVSFWGSVDFIGIDAYFNLTGKYDPTPLELINGWNSYKANLSGLYSTWKKPIIFTEIGYQSINGTNIHPWSSAGITDQQEQADSYRAAFKSVWNEPWLYGMYWWHWYYNSSDVDSFGIYGKTAEDIVKKWYSEQEKLYMKSPANESMASFDNLGNAVVKGVIEQNSTHAATANDEIRFQDRNGNDVAIIDLANGNIYIDGTLYENQQSLSPQESSYDFIIQDDGGNAVAYINEQGSMFLEGTLTQNGNP